MKPYKHQVKTLALYSRTPVVFDISDPGTGKTRPAIEAWHARRKRKRMLVIAPKSILESVWKNEFAKWAPGVDVAIAAATNRAAAFDAGTPVVATNTDATKWVAANLDVLKNFDTLVVDESSYFKHRSSGRSKALLKIRPYFQYVSLLTGTPNSNSVTDMWHQMLILDGGKRLGQSFFRFQSSTCDRVQVGPRPEMANWVDRPGAFEAVCSLISDISIRHEFDECTDIPPMKTSRVAYELPSKVRADYIHLQDTALLQLEAGEVRGVQASALRTKLLQLCSGAVYTEEGKYTLVDPGRYELITDLVEERQHSLVFFNWTHQRNYLQEALGKRKIKHAVIDGSVSSTDRRKAVEAFQAGELQTMLLHPKSAAHGLTLTKGTSVIWASPIYEPDLFRQGLHRVRRSGQTKRTETVLVEAKNTVERVVYSRLQEKDTRMMGLLSLLKELTQ